MSDTAGLNLKQPEKMDWDNYNPGSAWSAPVPAFDALGNPITYTGQLPSSYPPTAFGATKEGYRQYVIDGIKLAKNGNGVDGKTVGRVWASIKPFQKNGKAINASAVGNLFRAAGILAKPQTNDDYDNAFKQTVNKIVKFTTDWRARNKDTGEEIRGYNAFPDDPDRPGQKLAILKQGDTYFELDEKGKRTGVEKKVTSEVLFANTEVKFFQDPNRK